MRPDIHIAHRQSAMGPADPAHVLCQKRHYSVLEWRSNVLAVNAPARRLIDPIPRCASVDSRLPMTWPPVLRNDPRYRGVRSSNCLRSGARKDPMSNTGLRESLIGPLVITTKKGVLGKESRCGTRGRGDVVPPWGTTRGRGDDVVTRLSVRSRLLEPLDPAVRPHLLAPLDANEHDSCKTGTPPDAAKTMPCSQRTPLRHRNNLPMRKPENTQILKCESPAYGRNGIGGATGSPSAGTGLAWSAPSGTKVRPALLW